MCSCIPLDSFLHSKLQSKSKKDTFWRVGREIFVQIKLRSFRNTLCIVEASQCKAGRKDPAKSQKETPLSLINKRQRRNYLCGTTLVPVFTGTRFSRYRANPAQPTHPLLDFGALLKGDTFSRLLTALHQTGSSLKAVCGSACPHQSMGL